MINLIFYEFRLEKNMRSDYNKGEEGLLYVELISHMKRVTDYILKQEPEMREKMEEIAMGGQVYETLTDQLLKQGRAEGHAEGIFLSVSRLAENGRYSEKEACEILGTEYDKYLVFKENNRGMKSNGVTMLSHLSKGD